MDFTLCCPKICFAAIYAVFSRNLFCCGLRTFCVETNYGQNVVRGEKMTNIMYASKVYLPIMQFSSGLLFHCEHINFLDNLATSEGQLESDQGALAAN